MSPSYVFLWLIVFPPFCKKIVTVLSSFITFYPILYILLTIFYLPPISLSHLSFLNLSFLFSIFNLGFCKDGEHFELYPVIIIILPPIYLVF